jgi:hypothetical protein
MTTFTHNLARMIISALLLLPAYSIAAPAFNLMTSDMTPLIEQNAAHVPVWLKSPALENHLAVISIAPMQKIGGLQAQYLSAIETAQNLLTEKFKTFQSDLQYIKQNNNSPDARAYTYSAIKDLVFNQAIVKDEWTDPQSGQLYLWMVLPTTNRFSAMLDSQ